MSKKSIHLANAIFQDYQQGNYYMNINPQDLIPPAAMSLLKQCYLCGADIQGQQRRHITVNAKPGQGQLTLMFYAVCEMCALMKPLEVAAIGKGTRQPQIITNLS